MSPAMGQIVQPRAVQLWDRQYGGQSMRHQRTEQTEQSSDRDLEHSNSPTRTFVVSPKFSLVVAS